MKVDKMKEVMIVWKFIHFGGGGGKWTTARY